MRASARTSRRKAPDGVVVFTGHMMDKVGRVAPAHVPRFPREREAAVSAAIRNALDRLDARTGFSSATCGGDILFIEHMLARGARVHVVLPYGEEHFIRDCIRVPGPAGSAQQFQHNRGRGWLARYRAVRRRLASLVVLGDTRPQNNEMASDCCNRVALGLGVIEARARGARPTLLALWDGWSGDAPGGTRSMIRLAGGLGMPIEYLEELQPRRVEDILHTARPAPGIGSQPVRAELVREPQQQICAILFADVMEFSTLDEATLPGFVAGYLNPLASLIQGARHSGYGPLDYNTWGDGLFCVFDTMHKAGIFARRMQHLCESGAWRSPGRDGRLRLRIALHAGPVYRIPDPVSAKDTFVGTNVNLAARIEAATRPGDIFCSRAFAALAAAEGVEDFRCEPLGDVRLPKGAGTHPLFRLRD